MNRIWKLAIASLAFSSFSLNAAIAVPSSQDLVSAIEKAKVLSAGTRISAALSNGEAYISTFKNAKATDEDCKIEAILVAKALMDLAPSDINRVNVYFYNAMRLNKRKEVSVSAGDVKAFGSGQLSQDQLLGSIAIKESEVSDQASKAAAYLQQREAARSSKTINSYVNGDTLEIVTELEPDMNDLDIKLEGTRVAQKIVEKTGTSAKRIKVSFADPVAKGSIKEMTFDLAQLTALDKSLQSALYSLQVAAVTTKIDLQTVEAVDGAVKVERADVLKRLKELDKKGVGIEPFKKQFFDIEKMVSQGNDEQAAEAIKKLAQSVADQEARTKDAKNAKPSGKASAPASSPMNIPKIWLPSYQDRNPDGLGGGWKVEDIVKSPDKYIAEKELQLKGAAEADRNPNFARTLSFLYWKLADAKKWAEAAPYGQRFLEIEARYHHWENLLKQEKLKQQN